MAILITAGADELSFHTGTLTGDLTVAGAAMVFGLYTLFSKKIMSRFTPLQFATIMASFGAISLFLIGLPSLLTLDWSKVTIAGAGGVVYSGLLAIGAAYIIWNYGLTTVGAVRTSSFQNMVPVLGVFFGVLLLNEALTLQHYVGSGVAIAGVIITRQAK